MTTTAQSKTPGTWNVATGKAVKWPAAISAWSTAARAELLDVATTYHDTITYTELQDAIWDASGVRTRVLLPNWIGDVLEAVALECVKRDELLLTALCVHQDGTVGDGFAGAASHFLGAKPVDPDTHAADVRLLIYRKYASDLPPGGGVARLTPQVAARRAAAAPEPIPAMCPVHHTTLPVSGQCDEC